MYRANLKHTTILPVVFLGLAVFLVAPFDGGKGHLSDRYTPAQNHAAFIRGDVDESGRIHMADVAMILDYLFNDGPAPDCLKAADANDDGTIDVTDALGLAVCLVRPDVNPPAPYPMLGFDPTPDALTCAEQDPVRVPEGPWHVYWNGVSCITTPCPDLTARSAEDPDIAYTITHLNIEDLHMDEAHAKAFIDEVRRGIWIVYGMIELGPDEVGNTLVVERILWPSGLEVDWRY